MATSTAGYFPESIPVLRSYVENQGDKLHPLSDELRVMLRTPVLSSSPHHQYHIEELRSRLVSDEAED